MTSLYTELITNVAAAAIMFPITASMASLMDMDLRPLLITLAIAASSSFSTPVGYQTNLMVYGPGGYRFTDFTRAGILLNLLVGATVTASVYAWFFVMGWR
jgi:di/tricarboxylate transporter